MRVVRLGVVLLSLACSAQAAGTDGGALDPVMAGLRGARHLEVRYTERRYLAVLRAPLESRGLMRFDAPDRLERIGDPGADGVAERVVVEGDVLTMRRGTAAPVTLDLREHPEVAPLVGGVRALLAGDAASLRRDFEIDMAGDAAHWQMVLRPRRDELVRWLRVDGEASGIKRIETQEADGDRSEMVIGEPSR